MFVGHPLLHCFQPHSMMYHLLETAKTDPREPALVSPKVMELEGYHGHAE